MDQRWDDARAAAYLRDFGEHALNRLWLDHVTLPEHGFLLDVGCGGGASIKEALRKEKTIRATGIDPTPFMINEARTALPRMDFYETGADRIPLPTDVVHVALANCSAVHWPSIEDGLREIYRVLRPQGQLLVMEEAFSSQDVEGQLNSPQDLPKRLKEAKFHVLEHGHHNREGESYWATLAQKP